MRLCNLKQVRYANKEEKLSNKQITQSFYRLSKPQSHTGTTDAIDFQLCIFLNERIIKLGEQSFVCKSERKAGTTPFL